MYFPGLMTGTPEALARMIADRESRSGGGGGISDYLGLAGAGGGMGLGALLGSVIPIPGLGTLLGAALGGTLGGLAGGGAQIASTPEGGGDPRARQYAALAQQGLQGIANTGASLAGAPQQRAPEGSAPSLPPQAPTVPPASTGPRVFPQQTLDAMSPIESYQAKTQQPQAGQPGPQLSRTMPQISRTGLYPRRDLDNYYASLLARRRYA